MSSTKISMYILLSLGGALGGFVAKLFGAAGFSGWWFIWSTVGTAFGVYVWYKMGQLGK